MDCKDIQDNLSAWVDGALTEAEAQRIRDHVSSCPVCAKEAEALERISVLLRRSQDAELTPGFRSRLMAELLQREREKLPLYFFSGMRVGWETGAAPVGVPVTDGSVPVRNYREYSHRFDAPSVPPRAQEDTVRYMEIPPTYFETGG